MMRRRACRDGRALVTVFVSRDAVYPALQRSQLNDCCLRICG
jgi:hypothetical protein